MKFRIATLDDLPTIVAIYNATIPSRMVTADTSPVSVESKREWFEKHTPGNRPIWIIEEENKIAGWISLTNFHERPAYNPTCEVSIYLDASFQFKGMGRKALQYAIDHCPQLGIKTLIGLIFDNNAPSLKLFRHFDFEQWGFLPRVAELDGIDRGVVILGKRIDN